ncbi:MAG: aminotransferase class V-fold PLP-dependent enzyme [Planctomycetota bacterium]
MNSPIYLDCAATTQPLERVVQEMARVHLDAFGNPSSTHGFGEAPRKALEDAREFLRGTVGAARLVFTSGGTEADVLGLAGAVSHRAPGRVLVGAADHPAILAQRDALARSQHRLIEVPVDDGGTMEPEALFDVLGKDVRCVALLHGHNELGSLARLDDLTSLVRRVAPDAHIHVDLVQTYGKVSFDFDDADVDSVAAAGHKLHGPRGIGFLALSSEADVVPMLAGGGQEAGLRGGTENVAGAVGLAVAAEHALSHLAEARAHMEHLLDDLLDALCREVPNAERLGATERRLPHILSLRLPGVNGETLQQRAAARGVALSIGSACHAGKDQDNHVLRAIGLRRRGAREVVRLSVCPFTTADEIARAGEILCEEAAAMRAIAPSR